MPLLAVLNTAIRYLVDHPSGEPTADREPPGTEPTDDDDAQPAADDAEPTDRSPVLVPGAAGPHPSRQT